MQKSTGTSIHALRDYGFLRAIWQVIVLNSIRNKFFSANLKNWLVWNLTNEGRVVDNEEWSSEIYRVQRVVGAYWAAPERGWIKFNTDGVISVSNGTTSIGRIFWDHCAKWISSFTMQTREETMFKIEVKAILEGLKIAWDSDFKQLKVECDKALVVETILAGDATNSRMSELRLIYQLLERDWRVCFRYILRDLNKIVNHIAKLPSLYYNEIHFVGIFVVFTSRDGKMTKPVVR
ncbi:hypothetical protein J1N35_017187 [Gossypium stocksii]|uniref:RNase H type-1 domain-containing protein n=1 Tax=Gossypium stocksii TaxID=47602 RepID=A0A9D3VNT2_9ROSI|nr:hypothetical protein J1N35_017187 [Gossypium stocksii]